MWMILLAAAHAASPSTEEVTALSGRWRLAEARQVVQSRIEAAIDTTLAPFNIIIRGVARPIMLTAVTFCDGYNTNLASTAFTIHCDDLEPVTGAFDQPPRQGFTAAGHPYKLSARLDGNSVHFEFRGEDGLQRVVYRPGPQGELRVHKSMHADRLDRDIYWDMRYRRE